LKKIFPTVFAGWALIMFIATILPVALLLWIIGFIKEPLRTEVFRQISKVWIHVYFFLTGCRLEIKGKENFIKGENYIVVCNHNSFIDILVATPFIPGANKTIAKAELAKYPIFGLVYKRGSILVDRKDKMSRQDSFRKMRYVLEMGMHMCIYAEGTRNRTQLPLKEFHDGAFRLAVETGKSIIPALIFNTRKILPPEKSFYFKPAKIEMHFLPPIPVSTEDDAKLLKEKVYKLMTKYYVNGKLEIES
jgi:1-acyl-sn-glycerol-3-phosphate acyltransferase